MLVLPRLRLPRPGIVIPRRGILSGPTTSEPLKNLLFISNGTSPSTAFIAFQFANPQSNGLPIWGPSNAGVTWLWEYAPVQQTGYYVTFWWSENSDSFTWDGGNSNTYYGCHPYPPGGASGTTHNWEIAGFDTGQDVVNTRGGGPKTVVKDGTRYTQALRVTHNGGTKTGVFYTSLPSVANNDVIETTSPSGFGNTNPPNPAITIGDSPWFASYQHERLSGKLGRWKIFSKVLSESDTLSEGADMSRLTTSEGLGSIWWGKKTYRQDDIDNGPLCDYGTARRFLWANSNKATLVDP